MANLSTFPVSFLISIILISTTPLSIAQKVSDNEIKYLCSKTSNPELCYKVLKSDRRTSNVDARGLTEVSVDLATKKANKTYTLFTTLANGTRDSNLRDIYNLCSKNYNDAIRDLQEAKHNLKSQAGKNLLVQVNDASQELKNCQEVFGVVTDDHDRAHIKKENLDFEFLLRIVEVMSDNLQKK